MSTRLLLAEGVARAIVTSDDPDRFDGDSFPEGVEVVGPHAARRGAAHPARHEGHHGADPRSALRGREAPRRASAASSPDRGFRVVINERICEGCGDCGDKSNCLSVRPVDTPYGRKTQIHQTTCNHDFSCLQGDCPSFLLVTPGKKGNEARTAEPPADLPEPRRLLGETALLRMPGVGGRLRGPGLVSLLPRGDQQEGRAIALQAGEVLTARGLMNLGLQTNSVSTGQTDRRVEACSPPVTAALADTLFTQTRSAGTGS